MKHSGRARKSAYKIIAFTLVLTLLVIAGGVLAVIAGTFVVASSAILLGIWAAFALFTLYFFRDPTPRCPPGTNLVLAPAHGKVDVVDTTNEPYFMGGECRRVSIFLSVFDVHVQNAPIDGKVALHKYTQGQFLNALRTEASDYNENVLLGFEPADPSAPRVAVRLLAGAIARRIVSFVQLGDEIRRGDRISLIQFGSRADVYLPLNVTLKVKSGDKVTAGETVLAALD